MTSVYAMQRANGDWFALDDYGRLRVPVFHNARDAMEARSRHPGMLLFKPVVLDERALNDLAPTQTEDSAGYWLVSNPSIKLRRGRPHIGQTFAGLCKRCIKMVGEGRRLAPRKVITE